MPKHLYLVRHAEAAPKEARQEDKARELTQTGIKDCLHLAAWFAAAHTQFDVIVSSSAVRAEQTAGLIAEGMKLESAKTRVEDVLYEASVRQILQYVNELEDADNNAMLIGHNPAISYLAEYLTKADIGDMMPASAAIIRFDLDSWKAVSENTGQLVKYVSPETGRTPPLS